jgi:hypothetical protein
MDQPLRPRTGAMRRPHPNGQLQGALQHVDEA